MEQFPARWRRRWRSCDHEAMTAALTPPTRTHLRVTSFDGVELDVVVVGAGPTLVLVHGHGGAKEDFADHLDALAATHRVVAFDHRGHGASDKPTDVDAYSIDILAADLDAVVTHFEAEPIRLLGHSMGGVAARRYLLADPGRVEAVVFMDTCGGPVRGWDPEMIEIAARTAIDDGKVALKELLDAFSPLNNPAFDRLVAERPGYQEFCDRKWADLSEVAWAALLRSFADQPDDREALRRLDLPTLVLVGEHDEAFLRSSKEIADLVPGASLAVLAGGGHSPQMESADAWRHHLVKFLDALDGSGARRAARTVTRAAAVPSTPSS